MGLWIRQSYTRRLFLWLSAYSLLLVGCFMWFQYEREKEFKAAELNSRLQAVNARIAAELEDGMTMEAILPGISRGYPGLRVTLVAPDGMVVYDNSLDSLPPGNHSGREEIAEAMSRGEGFALRRHSESTGENYFYSATRAGDGTVVRTALPYTLSLSRLLEADYTFLWIMGGVAVAFCLAGYLVTRRLGQHIVRLKDFASRVEQGETVSDTAPFPHDELGDISNNIVRLYARLQQALADRDRQHALAMQQQRDKERIKKQLTNNINHELKTPVAAIGVCLETMQAHERMDAAKRREFIERCLAHTARLKRLLDDVALLTRMDDGGAMIAMEKVDLTSLIASVAADCAPLASGRGMRIDNIVAVPLTVKGNPRLLESVFYNLIDNAVAYSGGTAVTVRLDEAAGGKAVITVSDDGCGVPAEHLPHLFERFYRIDKGRSRAMGGTGLGLAIVKNAVQLHGGSISAANLRSGGLSFTITLPIS